MLIKMIKDYDINNFETRINNFIKMNKVNEIKFKAMLDNGSMNYIAMIIYN